MTTKTRPNVVCAWCHDAQLPITFFGPVKKADVEACECPKCGKFSVYDRDREVLRRPTRSETLMLVDAHAKPGHQPAEVMADLIRHVHNRTRQVLGDSGNLVTHTDDLMLLAMEPILVGFELAAITHGSRARVDAAMAIAWVLREIVGDIRRRNLMGRIEAGIRANLEDDEC